MNKQNKKLDFRRFIKLFALLMLLLLPVLICIYFVNKFAVEVPYADEWLFLRLVKHIKNNPLSLLSPRNSIYYQVLDHILIFTQLVMFIIGTATKFSFIADILGSVCILICINILFILIGWQYFRQSKHAYLAIIPIPWIACSLRQWDNLLMGYQICIYLVSLFCLMCTLLLCRAKDFNRYFGGAVICAFIASITFGVGILAWPLGFIQLFLQNHFSQQTNINSDKQNKSFFQRQKITFAWLLISIGAITLYKVSYCPGPAQKALLQVFQTNWTAIPIYFLTTLGDAFAADPFINQACASAMLLLFIWTVWTLKNEDYSLKREFIIPIMLVFFGISYCVLLALGRVVHTPATLSRYSTIPIFAFAGLYILVIGSYTRLGQKFSLQAGFVLALSFVLISLGMSLGFLNAIPLHNARLTLLQIAQTYRMQKYEMLKNLIYDPPLLNAILPVVEKNHWSFFAESPLALKNLTEVFVPKSNQNMQTYSLDLINGHPLSDLVVDSAIEPSFKFEGWIVNSDNKGLEGGVLALVDNRKYVIPAVYGIIRSDVASYLNNTSLAACGFSGSCRSDLFEKGKHVLSLAIISPDKKHYYCLNNVCHFEIK